MKVYDRKSRIYSYEKQYKEKILLFLYENILGRIILKIVINPIFSKIYGLYNDSFLSKYKITKWIKKYDIDPNLYENEKYNNFNSFFTRKLKKYKLPIKTDFISPCEGKLMVYKINDNLKLKIKNSDYTLSELTQIKDLKKFRGGYCFVYHLTVDCYHRYCYVDNGMLLENKSIKGKLHTVSSISKDYKIYKENSREVSLIRTENYGKMLIIEVGALLVGKIKNNLKPKFKRGEEKGYFKLGGSSIIIITQKNKVLIDNDILKNSLNGVETKVQYMEKIGVKYD